MLWFSCGSVFEDGEGNLLEYFHISGGRGEGVVFNAKESEYREKDCNNIWVESSKLALT